MKLKQIHYTYLCGCSRGCTGETFDNRTSYPDATPANMAAILYRTNSTKPNFGLVFRPINKLYVFYLSNVYFNYRLLSIDLI